MAEPGARTSRRLPLLAAVIVLALAAGALFWPRDRAVGDGLILLVFDSSGQDEREARIYAPLAEALAEVIARPVPLRVVSRVAELRRRAAAGPCFLLVPDGLALSFARADYAPLVVGRKVAPQNLRPRGVLVWRRSAGEAEEPWLSRTSRTVLGDSLSLSAMGPWAFGTAADAVRHRLAVGPDPYDHAPVLHAARLGAFDYALVRQWDAERFLASGLLDPEAWSVRPLTPPVPDLVLLVSRTLPAGPRLAVRDLLAGLGRGERTESEPCRRLAQGLDMLRLAGFNLLIDADFDLVRAQVRTDWLQETE
jgi:hypothetical protein